jgi:hypothetical protein
MATLGWLGWRSIWAPPKGGEAATVPCSSYVDVDDVWRKMGRKAFSSGRIFRYLI